MSYRLRDYLRRGLRDATPDCVPHVPAPDGWPESPGKAIRPCFPAPPLRRAGEREDGPAQPKRRDPRTKPA